MVRNRPLRRVPAPAPDRQTRPYPHMKHQVELAHHHIFKCAGTTFAWILQRNYPGAVLHVEGDQPNRRIRCEDVAPLLTEGKYGAVSSHLLTLPEPGQELAALHFVVVRDPVKRLESAFRFKKRRGDFEEGTRFIDFVEKTRAWNADFQSRYVAAQTGMNADPKSGWRLPESETDIARPGVLFGTVEAFDQALVVLEGRLAERGIAFDAAYPASMNSTESAPAMDATREELDKVREYNRNDDLLVSRVNKQLSERYQEVDPTGEQMEDFTKRCRALAKSPERKGTNIPTADQWVRLNPWRSEEVTQ